MLMSVIKAATRPTIVNMVAKVYIPVLFPLTFLIALSALKLDALLGVLSVGFALNSVSFCFILVPLLLAGSLIEKVVRQEPQLVDVFGEEYERYRREVPLFIPWKLLLPSRTRSS